jgi:hypothetical protein
MLNFHTIEQTLSLFPTISLEEINASDFALMSRIDSKYLIHQDFLPDFFGKLLGQYRILDIGGVRIHKYETLYFDTEGFSFYTMHHNKRGNRIKIRIRRYVENGLIFLEVKEKSNKSVTSKNRIKMPYFPENLIELKSLIEAQGIEIEEEELQPQLWTFFKRITLVNPNIKERLTIDLGLRLRNGAHEMNCENMIIIELKRERAQAESPIMDMMREWQVREQGFSKYTIGTALINDDVKKNNFKLKLTELNEKFGFELLA